MPHLSRACAALLLVQAGTLQAEAQAPRRSAGERGPVTAAEIEAVRAKIRPCWNMPDTASMRVVTILVQMNRDATPARAEVVDKERYNSDVGFRVAADAAHRAVMNPRCQPWPLPAEAYATWRSISFNFDPRDYYY